MRDDERMFAQLMEPSPEAAESDKQQPKPISHPAKPNEPQRREMEILDELLEELSQAGYTSHSYRFTENELRWLRRFCLRLSEALDRPVSHNTFIRLLFRLADAEWRSNPEKNKLRTLILGHDDER